MVSTTDLKVYKTTNNLGGAITATEVILATPNNLFSNVPKNELVIGEDYYAAVYLKNTHPTESMDNFKLWLNTKSLPADTEIKWGFDNTLLGGTGYRWSPFKNFNGSSDLDEIPSSTELQLNNFTVAAWFKTTKNYSISDGFVVNKGGQGSEVSGSNMSYKIMMTTANKIEAGFEETNGTDHYALSPLTYNDGNWHRAVVSYDGATVKLYIDGVTTPVATHATATTPEVNTKPVRIGANSQNTNNYFLGQIDEVVIYNRSWSTGEVTQDFATNDVTSSGRVFQQKYGIDDAIKQAQTIVDKYTAPTGITWKTVEIEPTDPQILKLKPGVSFPIWLWYHVNANAVERLDDNEIFAFKIDIPSGGTGTGGGGTGGGGGGGTGGNPPPAVADYKVAIIGDEGCGSITNNVISRIGTNGYDFVVSVGDHAYASAGCWTTAFGPLKNANKLNSAYGNHEYSESGGITPYKTFFGHSLTYFTFKFQNIQFFVLDTNINMDVGSAQNTFITNALTSSQLDNTVVWRIAIFHHPMYGSPSQHAYDQAGTRANWHQKFQDAGVKIVCTGHNHNWQRTKLLAYNSGSPGSPIVAASVSPFSNDTPGFVHVISGTSGHDSSSNLYGLGSQPSFQSYQNNTHNGLWEIVATNGGNTLTCSFVDVGGAKFDTIVFENAVTPTSDADQFGITKLNPTKTGGREWFNKWGNGHARTIFSSGTSANNRDPDDIYADLHANSTSSQGNRVDIDGLGTMTMTGEAPRMYINDQNRILKWNNVEVTCYYRYLSDYPTGSIFVHCRITGRSEHQDEYLCCGSGHTAGIFESKKNGVLQLRKELIHPAYADDQISSTTGGEVNTWIGMKLVLRDEGGLPHAYGYRDTTDGLNGGNWQLIIDKLDNNDWPFTDGTEISTYDACNGGTGTCSKVSPRTSKIVGQANSCYLRCDSSVVEFKKFSIREIDPT